MKTILIVDDEEAVRTEVGLLLSDGGYKYLEAFSGNSALQILQKSHIDLIISDVNMSDGTGFDLLRGIKALYG